MSRKKRHPTIRPGIGIDVETLANARQEFQQRLAGTSIAQWALEHGLKPQTVYYLFQGRSSGRKLPRRHPHRPDHQQSVRQRLTPSPGDRHVLHHTQQDSGV